jgi:hypothetical protein
MAMTFRRRRSPVLWVGVFGLLALVGRAPGQTVVVTAKSATELADDLEYLIKAVAPEGDPTAQAALDGLGQFKGAAILKGLDRSRGFRLAVTLSKDFPGAEPPTIVVAVPVSDFGQLLDSLKELGVGVDDQPGVPGFSHKVTGPNGNPSLFVLQSKGYALISPVPDGADRLRAMDPSSWRTKGRPEAELSVKLQLSDVPAALKDQALNQIEAQVGQKRDRQPGESDAEYRGRLAGEKVTLDALKSLIRDADAVTLDLDVDRKAGEIALEAGLSAQAGTALANSLRSLQGRRSRFQGPGRDAIFTAWANLPVAKEVRDTLTGVFDQTAEEGLKKIDSDEERKLAARLTELLKSNLNAPEIDLGIWIDGPSPAGGGAGGDADHLVVLAGMRLQDSQEFERLVREAAAKLKPEKGVTMSFDVAKAGDGTPIHQVTGPLNEGNAAAKVAKQFGKASLFFAFRRDAVLASFGEAGLAPLRRAIEGAANPPASGPDEPLALELHLAKVGTFADGDQEALRRATAEVFRGQDAGRDRIRLGLKGEGDGIRLRLSIDVPALKLSAMMGRRGQP